MTIDWIHFTPWTSLAGGLMLGLASAMFILMNGRILGISGILLSLVLPAGFIEAPRIEAGYGAIAIAGLLVGFGTRYGSGCTSGHGVCGLSRLSLRSLVSTLTFMAFGFLVVYVMRHVQ